MVAIQKSQHLFKAIIILGYKYFQNNITIPGWKEIIEIYRFYIKDIVENPTLQCFTIDVIEWMWYDNSNSVNAVS